MEHRCEINAYKYLKGCYLCKLRIIYNLDAWDWKLLLIIYSFEIIIKKGNILIKVYENV